MNHKVIIIAEAGVNHNGSLDLAYKMIELAKEADADYVKFQTAIPKLVYSANTPKAAYQIRNTGSDEPQILMAEKIHLPVSDYKALNAYCNKIGIKFLSTPFDHVSIDVLEELNMDYFKIPSGEITNLPYLRRIGSIGKPVIMSTGMAKLGEIEDALDVLLNCGLTKDQLTILHCNTEYPTPMVDVNLHAMQAMANAFGVKVGYSDHTEGIEVPIAAVALGATLIEKHFTLDKTMEGPDHKASLDPIELKNMVRAIRNIEVALGSGLKSPTESEKKNINVARRSIHLVNDLPIGHILTAQDLIMKRPGDGISPMEVDRVLGKKVIKPLFDDGKLTWEDIQ
jgi:N,N'-diacetyllegionaminate synthase